MSSSVIGGQNYSISREGLGIFQQGKISTVVGGISLDLASAPIHFLIHAGVGGIDIYRL